MLLLMSDNGTYISGEVQVSDAIALREDCWKLQEVCDEPDESLLQCVSLRFPRMSEITSYFAVDQSFCNSDGDGKAISRTGTSSKFINDHTILDQYDESTRRIGQHPQTMFVDIVQDECSFTHLSSKS